MHAFFLCTRPCAASHQHAPQNLLLQFSRIIACFLALIHYTEMIRCIISVTKSFQKPKNVPQTKFNFCTPQRRKLRRNLDISLLQGKVSATMEKIHINKNIYKNIHKNRRFRTLLVIYTWKLTIRAADGTLDSSNWLFSLILTDYKSYWDVFTSYAWSEDTTIGSDKNTSFLY